MNPSLSRIARAAAAPIALAAVAGGCFFDMFGPRGDDYGYTYEPMPMVMPYSARILTGDTVRFVACIDYAKCYGGDTGDVVSTWSVPNTNVVSLASGSLTPSVASKTSVLVRGIAPGRVTLTIAFPKGAQVLEMFVADSTDITSIELPGGYLSDSLRIGQQGSFFAQLRDVAGNVYRTWPTTWSVNDTTVVKLTRTPSYDGSLQLRADALKAGTTNLVATFRGLTATRKIKVVP